MSINILLVDDHAVFREGLKLLLEVNADIKVVGQTDNGRDAIQKVKVLHPHIVIMDISMQDLDGIGTMDRIKSLYPQTKVIVLSMHSMPEYVYRAFDVGADGYVVKESAGSEVVRAIRQIMVGKRYLASQIADAVVEQYLMGRKKKTTKNPLDLLSARELEVLLLLVKGHSIGRIAEILCLSTSSVVTYRHRLMEKLSIDHIPGLTLFAIKHGLIPSE